MGITYEDALNTLSSMFGAPWTQQTLGAVLRHFKGHMENTIEAILAHGDGSPMALVNRLRGGDDMSNSMSMQESDEAFARRLAASSSTASSSSSSSSSAAGAGALPASSSKNNGTPKKGRGNPTTLPPDFLRIPGRSYPDSGSTNSGIRQDVVNQNQPNSPPQTQQMLADEQLARMLQDEMFMRELSRNPEFAFLAQGGGVGGGGGGGGGLFGLGRSRQERDIQQLQQQQQLQQRYDAGNVSYVQGPSMGEKIAGMGDEAKRRFSNFVRKFNSKNSNGGGAHQHETQGLLDEEESVTFSPMGRASDGGMEMGAIQRNTGGNNKSNSSSSMNSAHDAHNKKDK